MKILLKALLIVLLPTISFATEKEVHLSCKSDETKYEYIYVLDRQNKKVVSYSTNNRYEYPFKRRRTYDLISKNIRLYRFGDDASTMTLNRKSLVMHYRSGKNGFERQCNLIENIYTYMEEHKKKLAKENRI